MLSNETRVFTSFVRIPSDLTRIYKKKNYLLSRSKQNDLIAFFLDIAQSKRTVAPVVQHVHTGIEMGFGHGTLLFRGISYQQLVESSIIRGSLCTHTEKRHCHRNRAARFATGHIKKISVHHGQHIVDAKSVRRFREIFIDGHWKVSKNNNVFPFTYSTRCRLLRVKDSRA